MVIKELLDKETDKDFRNAMKYEFLETSKYESVETFKKYN